VLLTESLPTSRPSEACSKAVKPKKKGGGRKTGKKGENIATFKHVYNA
jgi:hypothetical protein